jgi:hypothetical protein
MQLVLPLIFALLVFLACGLTDEIRTEATAPASSLKLLISIPGQFAAASTGKTSVFISVFFSDASGNFILSGKQKMTYNGVNLSSETSTSGIPLQPPNGAYTCVYTDEQGHQTTRVIPVPQGTFKITSPANGATLPIPKSAQTPPADSTPGPRPPEFTASMHIHYVFPVVPHNATATVWGKALAPPKDYAPEIQGTTEPMTGDYTLSDGEAAYGQGFDGHSPGPGSIALDSTIQWDAPPGGFQAVHISYGDGLSIPVTWTNG